jgi:Transposase DDE domain
VLKIGDHGHALYRKRKVMIEPVFAQMKFNCRFDRFARRGRSAARSERRLITATHNLKLHTPPNRAHRRVRPASGSPPSSDQVRHSHEHTPAERQIGSRAGFPNSQARCGGVRAGLSAGAVKLPVA